MATLPRPIRVRESNRSRIEAEILKVEGRASQRTADFNSIARAIEGAEARLSPVPKHLWAGVRVEADEHAVHRSQWSAQSTKLCLERRRDGWVLAEVARGPAPERARLEVQLPKTEGLLSAIAGKQRLKLVRPAEAN